MEVLSLVEIDNFGGPLSIDGMANFISPFGVVGGRGFEPGMLRDNEAGFEKVGFGKGAGAGVCTGSGTDERDGGDG